MQINNLAATIQQSFLMYVQSITFETNLYKAIIITHGCQHRQWMHLTSEQAR